MRARAHLVAAVVAYVTIAVFWTATVVTELSGATDAVVFVKRAIPWGFLVLVPALAVTGATGFVGGRRSRSRLVGVKRRRMPFIAANGLLVLVPCGFYLSAQASAGRFDGVFIAVQGLELLAGAVNLILMSLNMRDGMRLTGRLRRPPGSSQAAPRR